MRLVIGKIFDWCVLAINFVVIIIFIISAFSDHVSPKHSVVFAYLGILFPFFLIAVVCFAIYWLLRLKVYAAFSIIAIIICIEPVCRYVPLHFFPDERPENTIKLLSYNTRHMANQERQAKGSPNPIIEYLKESDADIICLQEYAYSVPDKKKGITESEIKGRMSDYKYYRSDKVMKDGEMFLAVFSKYPILSATPIKYKDRYITSMVYDIDVDGKTLTVINNHLESNRLSPEDRAFYDSMIRHFNPEKLDMVKSTLIDKLSSAYLIRAEQADNIARVIDSKHTPVVVCGDFNDTPISYTYNTVRGSSLKDAYQNSGLGPGITYHENKFLFRIDHILHSDNIKSYNATVDKVKHSDHYPVYVFLDIN